MNCRPVTPSEPASLLASPLLPLTHGLLAKFECHNPGGSHKVRAARHIVRQAVADGRIVPGHTTVIEKTGGNFGLGLLAACHHLGVRVDLAVGLSFSVLKRQYLQRCGARLIGLDMLREGSTPREVVEWHIANAERLGRHYFYTDQFNNPDSVRAHELETGPELVEQLRTLYPEVSSLTFVACAGTGASFTGIMRALLHLGGYAVDTVLVEPEGCNSQHGTFVSHSFEGMSVGIAPPFLDWSLVGRHAFVREADAVRVQTTMAEAYGQFVGNTSAACLAVAMECLRPNDPHHRVVVLVYDHSLWYPMREAQAA